MTGALHRLRRSVLPVLALCLGACAPGAVPWEMSGTGPEARDTVMVTLTLRVRDVAGKPVACVGLYHPAVPEVIADTTPRARSDGEGRLVAHLRLPRGPNAVAIGSHEYAGGHRLFQVRRRGLLDLGTMTVTYHPVPAPVTRVYPDCSGQDATSRAEAALAALTEAWWPAMFRRDSVFVDTALTPDFRWVHAGADPDVPKDRLIRLGLIGMPCGPGLVYQLTALRPRVLGKDGLATSYGTLWAMDGEHLVGRVEFQMVLLFRRAGERWRIREAEVSAYHLPVESWQLPSFDLLPARESWLGNPVTPATRIEGPCPRGPPPE